MFIENFSTNILFGSQMISLSFSMNWGNGYFPIMWSCLVLSAVLCIEMPGTNFAGTGSSIFRRNVFYIEPVYHLSRRLLKRSGLRFNIKMPSYQDRKSHCGDKTVVRSAYLHNGVSYTGKTTFSYWIRVLGDLWTWWHRLISIEILPAL